MALSKILENSISDGAVAAAKLKDFSAAVDLNGVELILDADQDTSITADTDDRIDFKIANVEHFSFSNSSGDTVVKPMVDAKDIIFQQYDGNKLFEINDGNFVSVGGNSAAGGEIRIYEDTDLGTNYTGFKAGNLTGSVAYQLPLADGSSGQALTTDSNGVLSWSTIATNTPTSANGQALGSAALEWSDLFLADGAVINFGADQDTNITHVADTGLTTNRDFTVGDDLFVSGGVLDLKNTGAASRILLYCEFSNAHAQTLQSQPHSAGATNTSLLPTGASSSLVSLVSADILTNKTLTSPVINTGTFGTSILPTSADGTTLGSASKEFSDLFLADASTIQFGADQDVTLTHVADTGILLNSTNKIQFNDASQFIHAPSATVLDIAATDEIELTATLIDIVGNLAISGNLNLAGDLEVVGSSSTTVTASGAVVPDANDGATLGTAALAFADIFLADGATIQLGNDEEITITHVADTGILFNTTSVIQFRDSAINIGSPADGDLDINADDEIELNSTLIDINGNVEISGTLAQADAITMATNKKIIFRDAAIHISSTADGDLSIAADDEIDLTSTLIDINGNVEISGTTAQVGVSTSTAKDIFNAGMSTKNGATSAGFVEFFEDSDNGTNKVTVIGPASTADVTLTLPNSAGTIATTATAADEATALAIALG